MDFFMATELLNRRCKGRTRWHPNLSLFYHKCKSDHFREVFTQMAKSLTYTHTQSYCKSIFLPIWSKVPQHQGFPSKKRSGVNLKFQLRVKQPPQVRPSTQGVWAGGPSCGETRVEVCRSNALGKQVRQKTKHDFNLSASEAVILQKINKTLRVH